MSGKKSILKRMISLSLLASVGFAAFLSLAQTDAALAQTAPPLGVASSFAVLGASAVTNTGPSVITGDLGISPNNASSVTGFPPGIVIGATHFADAVALQAQSDATTAYNNLAGQACNTTVSADLGGMTLTPGVYCAATSMGLTGTLTLDAQGNPNAVWVFQMGSTLTTATDSSVVFLNNVGQDCNVFWQVGSSATIGTRTALKGNVLALQSISMNDAAKIAGRALARNGAVTFINNQTNATVCAGVPQPGSVALFKVFNPPSINPGGTSTLTITFTNTNASAAVLQGPFTDNLPTGVTVVGTPTTTCSGGPSPTATATSVTLPAGNVILGGTVAVPGFCILTVTVTSTERGSYANTVPAGALYTDIGRSAVTPGVILKVETPGIPALSGRAMTILVVFLALLGLAAIRRLAT